MCLPKFREVNCTVSNCESSNSFVALPFVDFIDDVFDSCVTDEVTDVDVLIDFSGMVSIDSLVAASSNVVVADEDESDVVSSVFVDVASSSTSATPSITILSDDSAMKSKIISTWIVRMLLMTYR